MVVWCCRHLFIVGVARRKRSVPLKPQPRVVVVAVCCCSQEHFEHPGSGLDDRTVARHVSSNFQRLTLSPRFQAPIPKYLEPNPET